MKARYCCGVHVVNRIAELVSIGMRVLVGYN